jgi:hypothetical protein
MRIHLYPERIALKIPSARYFFAEVVSGDRPAANIPPGAGELAVAYRRKRPPVLWLREGWVKRAPTE